MEDGDFGFYMRIATKICKVCGNKSEDEICDSCRILKNRDNRIDDILKSKNIFDRLSSVFKWKK